MPSVAHGAVGSSAENEKICYVYSRVLENLNTPLTRERGLPIRRRERSGREATGLLEMACPQAGPQTEQRRNPETLSAG